MTKEIDKRLRDMETNYKLIKKDIHFIKKALLKVPTIEGMDLANEKLIKKVLEKTDEKYASKVTEKIVYNSVWVILAGIIIAGLKYLMK